MKTSRTEMHTTKVSSEFGKFGEGFKVQTSRLLPYLGSSSVFRALHLNNVKESNPSKFWNLW
jgi:hypothetical protein